MEDTRKTWAGTRSDIKHAVKEAVDALGTWSPYGAVVEARISYKSGLTQQGEGEALLDDLHRSDLRDIDDIDIDISPDRDGYYAEQERLREDVYRRRNAVIEASRKGPSTDGTEVERQLAEIEQHEAAPLPDARVSLRFSRRLRWGLLVAVRGPNRDQVEGLHSRLRDLLTRRQALNHLDIDFLSWLLPAVLIGPLIVLGFSVSHWAGWAKIDHKWEWQEIVAMVVGGLLAIASGVTLFLLYPRLEILDEGQSTHAERFGKSVVGAAVAIVLGVIAAAIYAHA